MFTKTNKGPEGPALGPTPTQDAIRPASSKPAARTAPSIISADMKIVGSVASEGEMQIDGSIDGDVSAISLTIGQSGRIEGEVKAETIVVRGEVKGAIRARKVELETGSKVIGDIVHTSLSIQANASFEGQVKHADDPLKQATSQGAAAAQNASQPTSTQPAAAPSSGGGATKPQTLSS
ncbi:MAG: polymer-forming cytoskeletal protein [Pseudomonadota bacterium]